MTLFLKSIIACNLDRDRNPSRACPQNLFARVAHTTLTNPGAHDFDCADERSDHHPYEEEVHLMIHGDTVAAALAVAAAAAALAGQ